MRRRRSAIRARSGLPQENAVDLILLDVMLPYMDGFTLCTQLRREHPDVPVIFLSARGKVNDKVDGFGHGADDYIAKPFEPTELLARIQAVLRRYRRCRAQPLRHGDEGGRHGARSRSSCSSPRRSVGPSCSRRRR